MRHAPPDLMIQIPLAVGLFDLDRADETIDAGEAAARRHVDELIELRDYVRLKPWTRWWRSASRALRRE
jgi:predicted acylesterase/phospholipase RssA